MIEYAANRGTTQPRRAAVVRRFPNNCEKRFVKALGTEMPTELANKFERHLRTKTKAGRLILALETQESL